MARRAAAVSGDRVLAGVRERLDKGWPAGLTVLTGDDRFHLDRALDALVERLVPQGHDDFALSIFGSEPLDVSKLLAAVRTKGMFATSRVVLLRELSALDGEPAPLVEYAQAPPEQTFLLVRAPELDLRRKLHKSLAGAGTLLTFSMSGYRSADQLRAIVGELAAEHGVQLARGVDGFLIEVCGGDLYRVGHEVQKLATWADDGESVSLDDARRIVAGSGAMSGWEVADHVLQRDAAGALTALRRLVDAGDEPIRILGGLASRGRSMLQAKAMLEGGAPRKQVVDTVRAWYYREALFSGLQQYRLGELMRFPARLLEADRTLKSRSIDGRAVLESLVRDLTGRSRV